MQLEVADGEGCQGGEEERGVAGLDVLVDVGGCLLEDQGPEVGDLGDERVPSCVEGTG